MMIDWHTLDDTVEGLANETDEIFPEILDASLWPPCRACSICSAALEARRPTQGDRHEQRRRFTQDVLSRFELEPRFEFLLTSEDVVDGKPHPEIYLKAAARLGVEPRRMVVFEDSHNGCRAAVTRPAPLPWRCRAAIATRTISRVRPSWQRR